MMTTQLSIEEGEVFPTKNENPSRRSGTSTEKL